MVYQNKMFLILGSGASGVAAAKLLKRKGAEVCCYDSAAVKNAEELSSCGCRVLSEIEYYQMLNEAYCLVVSPGVPVAAKDVLAARRMGLRVIGETELGYLNCAAPILAVTGTNGKSTTVSLLHELLTASGRNSRLLGNIGVPLCAEAEQLTDRDFVCLEVSSFQLETVHNFTPHIGIILNLTPDHLNRHGSMEEYKRLKLELFARQTETEYAVVNADSAELAGIGKNLAADVFYFSAKREVRGCYAVNGKIYFQSGENPEFLLHTAQLALPGKHNLENALAAALAAKLAGVENDVICEVLKRFAGIKHRLQLVDTVNGKTFYNDSKGTNMDAALCAANAMTVPTVMILGGSDKGYEFDELFRGLPENIVHVVLTGETRYRLLDAAIRQTYYSLSLCQDFSSAVKIAWLRAPQGGAVLLSPACASFDCFRNYEERGDRFIELVEELHEKYQ